MGKFWSRLEYFHLGGVVFSDAVTLYLGWWEFSVYRNKW